MRARAGQMEVLISSRSEISAPIDSSKQRRQNCSCQSFRVEASGSQDHPVRILHSQTLIIYMQTHIFASHTAFQKAESGVLRKIPILFTICRDLPLGIDSICDSSTDRHTHAPYPQCDGYSDSITISLAASWLASHAHHDHSMPRRGMHHGCSTGLYCMPIAKSRYRRHEPQSPRAYSAFPEHISGLRVPPP